MSLPSCPSLIRPPRPAPMLRARRWCVALGVAGLLGVSAATASAEVRTGGGTDPAGDAPAAADVVAFGGDYDTVGSLTGRVTFANPIPANGLSIVVVAFGERQADGTCRQIAELGSRLSSVGAAPIWILAGEATPRTATVSYQGANTITIHASDPALAGLPINCV